MSFSEEERRQIDEALKQGKLVIVTTAGFEAKINVEPKDKVRIIVRK